jgi:hypothetical protein
MPAIRIAPYGNLEELDRRLDVPLSDKFLPFQILLQYFQWLIWVRIFW